MSTPQTKTPKTPKTPLIQDSGTHTPAGTRGRKLPSQGRSLSRQEFADTIEATVRTTAVDLNNLGKTIRLVADVVLSVTNALKTPIGDSIGTRSLQADPMVKEIQDKIAAKIQG